MRLLSKEFKMWQLQAVIWFMVLLLSLFSNLQYDGFYKSFDFAILTVLFYAAILYGNGEWLIPVYFNNGKLAIYIIGAFFLLAMAVFARTIAGVAIFEAFAGKPDATMANKMLTYGIVSAIWIFLFSVLYRLSMDYFALNKKQGEIKAEKAQTELHLLKQQVHPHFLFNTLNNIYYVAQKKSPEAADLIERLSGIIRYFIEESKKERVYLKDEIDLLKSYIELESIRMRYEAPVNIVVNGGIDQVTIPPLLLMPLVENIFKHGIDKRSKNNFANICLDINSKQLTFTTQNKYSTNGEPAKGGKTGLNNLERRLKLYFENDYDLSTERQDDVFIASLKFPFYEN